MNVEQYGTRQVTLDGWSISIETYKLGDVYHCSISSVDPGARMARADGPTCEEAEARALEKAKRYLTQTRRFPTS